MRLTGRISVVAALVGLALALSAATAQAAGGFGVAKFEAGTCRFDTPPLEECSYTAPESQFYTQAAGHPPIGLTGFEVNTKPTPFGREPEGNVKDIRVDIPPGLSVNPQATCSAAELESETCASKKQCTQKQFKEFSCPLESLVGTDEVDASIGGVELPTAVSLPMYDLVPKEGVPAEFGVELNALVTDLQIRIVGGLSWYKEEPKSENAGVPTGDYHEYFTIKEVPTAVGLIKTRLKFTGTAGDGTFITLPSGCGTQTSYLHVDSYEHPGQFQAYSTVSGYPPKAISVSGCDKVPFTPSAHVTPANSQSDRPDGVTVKVEVPHEKGAASIDDSTVRDTYVSLPEGLTLNPAAASGLEACSDTQFGMGTNAPIACPAGSVLGTVAIEAPQLPPGSLRGNVYVGLPLSSSPESGQEYRIFIAAESARYGVGVRLEGRVYANAATGRLTTAVLQAPQVPFSDFILNFNSPHNPLANPLACGPATTNAVFVPYSGNAPALPSEAFAVDFDGKGGACPSPLPFGVGQSTAIAPTAAGAASTFSYSLVRPEGQQYISKLTTTIPAGLVASIAAIDPLCGEPQAAAGQCPASSEIGTTTATVGSGVHPYALSGRVYLTGPYAGQPFGLSIVVPAEKVGPYDFGRIVTRAAIGVDPYTADVLISSQLPTVVGGAPVRLRTLSVDVNRPGFTFNPTSCAPLTVQTALISTFGTAGSAASAVQASGCSALGFHPNFSARTRKKTSRAYGAELIVRLRVPKSSRANLKSVFTRLPKQLPARISTLNLACRQAVFAASPFGCPSTAQVGTVVVHTPVLPVPLRGSAILVSHGGAAFPDFDFVLSGDGVTMVLVGHTNIVKNITSSDFASVPDVPVSSVEVRLPMGRKSALGANGNLCRRPLYMPTVLTAQNGKVLRVRTRILVAGCPHKKHRRHRHRRHRRGGHGRKH